MIIHSLDYHSRLIVDSVSIKCLRCVVRNFFFSFSRKEYAKLYSTVVRFLLKRKFAAALE